MEKRIITFFNLLMEKVDDVHRVHACNKTPRLLDSITLIKLLINGENKKDKLSKGRVRVDEKIITVLIHIFFNLWMEIGDEMPRGHE